MAEPDIKAQLVKTLLALDQIRTDLDRLEHHVIELVRSVGATWEEIGDELGISRQAARQRFSPGPKRRRASRATKS